MLARGGASDVTLESVAAEAGVSKGGLLYHFRNKEALYSALLEAAADDVSLSMARKLSQMSAVRAYLEYSLPETDDEAAYFSALIAAVRSDDAVGPGGVDRLVEVFRRWEQPLLDEVPDPVLAETIRLVGYGLYLGSIAGLSTPPQYVLNELVERLVQAADQVPAP